MGSNSKIKDNAIRLLEYAQDLNKGEIHNYTAQVSKTATALYPDFSSAPDGVTSGDTLADYYNIHVLGTTGVTIGIALSNDMILGKQYIITFAEDQGKGIKDGAVYYVCDADNAYICVRLATDVYKVFEMVEATPA